METCIKRYKLLNIVIGIWAVLSFSELADAGEDPIRVPGIFGFKEKISAPDIALEDLDGKKVKLRDFRGKIVLLNFWATW